MPGMVVPIYNLGTPEAEAVGSLLSSRTAWAIQSIPGKPALQSETLTHKREKEGGREEREVEGDKVGTNEG